MRCYKGRQPVRCFRPIIAAALAGVLLAPRVPLGAQAQGTGKDRFVGTWATGPVALPPPAAGARNQPSASPFGQAPHIANQTLRQTVRASIGGTQVRVVLTNRFGTAPLRIGGAHVGVRDEGPAMVKGASSRLTFRGRPSVTIAAGSMVTSDPVAFTVPAMSELAIDLYFPDDSWATTSPATYHPSALTTNYLSPPGNHSGAVRMPVESTFQQWFYLDRVEVLGPAARGAVVTIGDSITDGTGSTPDTSSRWPDVLARRLAAEYGGLGPAVLNVGIAGNRLLSHNAGLDILRRTGLNAPASDALRGPNALFGPSALSRFDQDVLRQPGVTHVVVLETINDIGMAFDAASPTVDDLIAGHRALIERAHARGLKIYGGTLTPFKGAFYWTEAGEAKRLALNNWIRTGAAYDAVIDFDAAVRDPNDRSRLRPEYHPGDWLHGSDAGYKAMGGAVDLALFVPARWQERLAARRTVPRTPWGAPDIGGIWDFRTLTPLERPAALRDKAVLTREEARAFTEQLRTAQNADRRAADASVDIERAYNDFWYDWGAGLTEDLRTSLIVDPPDGRLPALTPAAQGRRRGDRPVRERVLPGARADGPEDLGLSERCLLGFNSGPPMLPSAYNNNVQIFQTPGYVALLNEMIHDVRIVPLDGRPHLPPGLRQWLGSSRGHWDGDTLVVESRNYTNKTGSFNDIAAAMGSGETLRLIERFTRIDSNSLRYEFTVDDPATFVRSFTAAIPMRRTTAPIYEYACHEGNYSMANLLGGARMRERATTAETPDRRRP